MIIALLAFVVSCALGAPSAPARVGVSTPARVPVIQSGYVDVTWELSSGSIDRYEVVVQPLSNATTDPLSDPRLSGYQVEAGDTSNSITWSTNGVRLTFHSAHPVNRDGRGLAPIVVRKVPTGAGYMADVDAAGVSAASWAAGLVTFHAGFNTTLLSCGLSYTSAGGLVFAVGAPGGRVFGSTATTVDGSSFSAGQRYSFAVARGPAGSNRTWSCSARAAGSSGAWTRLVVLESTLDSFGAEADLWYGVTASASGGSRSSLQSVTVTNAAILITPPAVPPRDLLGAVDLCVSSAGVVPVSVSVPGTARSASITGGLSGYYPYTVTVTAVEAGTGARSAPSAPVEGFYFYPRPMPPRAPALSMWLDSRYLAAGGLSRWPDSSMRGHDMTQPTAGLQPRVTAGNLYNPSIVTFTRKSAHHMVGGTDAFDLGIAGNFTAYVLARGASSTPQVLIGKGGAATTITSPDPGWAAVVYNDLYNPYPGFVGIRASDGYSPAAGVKKGWWIPNTGVTYWWTSNAPLFAFTATRYGNSGPVYYNTIADADDTPSVGHAEAAGDNTTGWPSQWWSDADPSTPTPALAADLAFRVGGPAVVNGDALRSFEGDMYQVLLYRESHDNVTRANIKSWLADYTYNGLCPASIATSNTNTAGNCDGGYGIGNLRCYQTCASGYIWFLGTWYDHWCQNGAWTGAPLLCRRGCPDAIPPMYSATCRRTILDVSFTDPESMLMFVTFPTLPIVHASRVWQRVVDPTSGNVTIRANSSYSDACARMAAGPSVYGIHPTRWNDYYLPWGTRAYTSVSVMVADYNSSAGLAIRISDSNNHYRIAISPATGLSLLRVLSGRVVTVARVAPPAIDIQPGVWYDIAAEYWQNQIAVVMLNASSLPQTYINLTDSGGPWWGSIGLYADGAAQFNRIAVNSTCDAFLQGRNMVAGMSVTWQCRPGYTPIGNTTLICNSAGNYGGLSLICMSRPPVFPANYSFTVPERSPNGTTVGIATAIPAGADQTVTYYLLAQYPYNASLGYVFTVVSCSGAIRVIDPMQLDYQSVRMFNLTIQAVPDGQMISATTTNVTIIVSNVVDPPQLIGTTVTVDESFVGPVSAPVAIYNPDGFTMVYSIGAGDSNRRFTIDTSTGMLYVRSPGLAFVDSPQYELLVQAVAQEDPSLQTNGVVTVEVIDVNTPPACADEVFFLPEGLAKTGTFVGMMIPSDVDVQSQWNQLTVTVTSPARKGATSVLRVDAAGAITFDTTITYGTGDPVYWYNDRKARDVFYMGLSVCDNGTPSLCANATATVVILATNVTDLNSIITAISAPSSGMKTEGGDVIKFSGRDFPIGAVVTATYSAGPMAPTTFAARNCFVKDATLVQCNSAEGWGASLTWKVFLNSFQVPSTVQLLTSYMAPELDSVSVDTTGFTTAGSGNAAVTIRGSNLGPANAPVTIVYGQYYEFTVPAINSVSHTAIKATLGPGCGSSLPVQVIVGGQSSTSVNPGASTISYPAPVISDLQVPVGALYTLGSLPTAGNVEIVLTGSNLGPATVGALPLLPSATYTGGPGGSPFTYTASCRKDNLAAAHTRIVCKLAAGVSYDFGWSVDVCGQQSPVAPVRTSYAPPVLNRVSGPGANRASTEGGQAVVLDGVNFGPLCCDLSNPATVTSVRYGKPGLMEFAATGCSVSSVSPSQITCLTGPGTGKDHVWQVTIGGQTGAVLVANTSYSPPVLYSFAGAADAANTQGYENVTIIGSNFGDDIRKIVVQYTDTVQRPSSFTGVLPGSPPGIVTYQPPWCNLLQAHKQLICGLRPGGGTGLEWSVVVDEQVSTAPTTSYGVPSISSLQLAGGKTEASSDGGDVLQIYGSNFALPHLIQQISYGPSGTEYSVAGNFTYVSHTQLSVTLSPSIAAPDAGAGTGMRFLVQVADQLSELSTAAIRIATPQISSVAPGTADTEVDPARPTIITVTGTEFGLLDPTAAVAVAFGNAGDNTLTLLPIISRSPSADEVASSTWVRPPSPIPQSVSFALPTGLGAQRQIKVVPYRRGSPPSLAVIAAMTSQGAAGVFSYLDPFIDYIIVGAVSSAEEQQQALLLFGGTLNASQVAELRKLDIRCRFCGPSQDVNKDSVLRVLEAQDDNNPTVYSDADYRVLNWTHRTVTVVTTRSAATVRIRLESRSPTNTVLTQVSGLSRYSDVSPAVSAIVGPSEGFNTEGGEVISFKAEGLASCVTLNVTVGGRRCALLDAPVGGQPIAETDARQRIILAQGSAPFAADFQWTIHCALPEGEGVAPVVLLRDNTPSSDAVTIRYAPPVIAGLGTWEDDADGPTGPGTAPGYRVVPFNPASPLVVPTESNGQRTVRIEGNNLGVCPVLFIATSSPIVVAACEEQLDPLTGRPISVPRPEVRRSHRFIEFPAPDGEGTGLDVVPGTGWTLVLRVGGQDAQSVVLWRYAPPAVTSISPTDGPTQGHTTAAPHVLTITGKNFGRSQPRIWLGSATRTWMNCSGVLRLSNSTLSCLLPEGSGVLLRAKVQVADLAGEGGEFNYTRPRIDTVQLATVSIDTSTNATTYTPLAAPFTPNAALPVPPTLSLTTVPTADTVIVIDGDSFGPRDALDNCVFAAWAQRGVSPAAVFGAHGSSPATNGPLLCGVSEDFLGEGQIAAEDVLEYSHTRIVVRAPAGAGQRVLTLRAGGQAPQDAAEYISLVYSAPALQPELVALSELSTDGGGQTMIRGLHIPRPPYPNLGNGTTLDFPLALPLDPRYQVPTEAVRVNFGARCLHTAADLTGRPPSGFERCIADSIVAQTATSVTFRVPPGVGRNKTVTLSIMAAGLEVARSSTAYFSYAPPEIVQVNPSPVYQRADTRVQYLTISGRNFGRLQDMADWTPEERAVSVLIAGLDCQQSERIVRYNQDMIQCQMTTDMPVGHRNVTVVIGGQPGSVPDRDPRSLFIVCAQDLYGMVNEACLACPLGATCQGFVPDATLADVAGVNITDGPVRNGRIQYDYGGIHTYPIPLAGFFNLNGSMNAACPAGSKVSGRDVCIVPCMPKYACLEDNVCAEAYTSLPPMYRCASCAKGFYRRSGDCEKCPNNSAAQFVLLLMVATAAAWAAYIMNKKNISPAFISIGLDYLQVVSIFSQTKVQWPAVIKELFHVLSAFNLNIEIIAPECFLPDVTFANKFGAIISMPIVVYLLFLTVHGGAIVWKRYWKGQTNWTKINAHLPPLISASLLLLYILYLYITRSLFDVFNCVPMEPPEYDAAGNEIKYLAAVLEECYKPGGAHLLLLPYAAIACVVYVIGYPAGVATLLWKQRELVMEDQLLRAKGVGENRLENPHAYDFRRTFSRVYYQFKPWYFGWILIIIVRKFFIAFSALMFSRNVAFQMAACLLVLFLAYSMQVRYSPYMSSDETDAVIRQHLVWSATSPLHSRLRATLARVEQHGRKRGHRNKLTVQSRYSAVSALRYLYGLLFNLNFVEATLLFSACLINLAGLLYEAARPADTFYGSSRDAITGAVLLVISVSLLYLVVVIIVDVSSQFSDLNKEQKVSKLKRRRSAKSKAALEKAGMKTTTRLPANVFSDGLGVKQAETTQMNPMFTKRSGEAVVTAEHAHDAIMDLATPPDQLVWEAVKYAYLHQYNQVKDLSTELSTAKAQIKRLQETIELSGLTGLMSEADRMQMQSELYRATGAALRPKGKRHFEQVSGSKSRSSTASGKPPQGSDEEGEEDSDVAPEDAEAMLQAGKSPSARDSHAPTPVAAAEGGNASSDGSGFNFRSNFFHGGRKAGLSLKETRAALEAGEGGDNEPGAAPAAVTSPSSLNKRASIRMFFGGGGSSGASSVTVPGSSSPPQLAGAPTVVAIEGAGSPVGPAAAGHSAAASWRSSLRLFSAPLAALAGGPAVVASGPAASESSSGGVVVANPLMAMAAARSAVAGGAGVADAGAAARQPAKKRLAGKVVAKSDGPAASSPASSAAAKAASTEAALNAFRERHAAVFQDDE